MYIWDIKSHQFICLFLRLKSFCLRVCSISAVVTSVITGELLISFIRCVARPPCQYSRLRVAVLRRCIYYRKFSKDGLAQLRLPCCLIALWVYASVAFTANSYPMGSVSSELLKHSEILRF